MSLAHNKISNKGFTLIETIIYIGIFSIIIAGALVSVYSIISSSASNQVKAMAEEEGNFLISKIDWALTDVKDVTISQDGKTMTVDKSSASSDNPIIISLSSRDLTIKRGANGTKNLNNSNIFITCPGSRCFSSNQLKSDTGIESVSAQLTITTKSSEGKEYEESFNTIKFITK